MLRLSAFETSLDETKRKKVESGKGRRSGRVAGSFFPVDFVPSAT